MKRYVRLPGCARIGSLVLALSGAAAAAPGQTCNVPADRPTVQAAVSDAACAQVVVAAGIYPESLVVARSLSLQGMGSATTELVRPMRVAGAGTVLTISAIAVEADPACYPVHVEVRPGAAVAEGPGGDFAIRAGGSGPPCPLLTDGFESGTVYAWSGATP